MIVRADLTIGQQCAQLVHAVGESTPTRVPENTVAVALRCKDKDHLLQLAGKLAQKKIPHVLIRECDGEPMAIGVEPTRDRALIRKVVSSLPLIK